MDGNVAIQFCLEMKLAQTVLVDMICFTLIIGHHKSSLCFVHLVTQSESVQ